MSGIDKAVQHHEPPSAATAGEALLRGLAADVASYLGPAASYGGLVQPDLQADARVKADMGCGAIRSTCPHPCRRPPVQSAACLAGNGGARSGRPCPVPGRCRGRLGFAQAPRANAPGAPATNSDSSATHPTASI